MHGKLVHLKRALACLAIGVGVLGGAAPLESHVLALAAPIGIVVLLRSLRRSGLAEVLLWSLLSSVVVAFVPFHWSVSGLTNITGISSGSSFLVVLISAPITQARVLLLIVSGHYVLRYAPLSRVYTLPALAVLIDLIVPQVFAWRWGDLMTGADFLRQNASWMGSYGLGAIVFFEGVLIHRYAVLVYRLRTWRKLLRALRSRLVFSHGIPILGWFALVSYGLVQHIAARDFAAPQAIIGVIQTNTARAEGDLIGDEAFATTAGQRFVETGWQAIRGARGNIDLLVAPESAFPFHGTDATSTLRGNYSPTFHGIVAFLSRAGRTDVLYNELADANPRPGYYNAMTLFSHRGWNEVSYHKRRLVPFGEFIPAETRFPWLRETFAEASRYVPGKPGQTPIYFYRSTNRRERELDPIDAALANHLSDPQRIISNWPVPDHTRERFEILPLICYESLFPELTHAMIREHPSIALIVNMSNDAWFGDSLEVYQHQGVASMRAIESGRYMLRANNTGLSTLIDPRGHRVAAPMGIGEVSTRVFRVPLIRSKQTIYTRYGRKVPVTFVIVAALLALYAARHRFRRILKS